MGKVREIFEEHLKKCRVDYVGFCIFALGEERGKNLVEQLQRNSGETIEYVAVRKMEVFVLLLVLRLLLYEHHPYFELL